MFCKTCGTQLKEGQKFCHKCGTPLLVQEENIEAVRKKKRLWPFVLLGALLVLIVSGILLFMIFSGNVEKKYDEQIELAERYIDLLDYDHASAAYRDAIRIDPEKPGAYRGLAEVYVAQREYDEAESILEEGFEKTGDESLKRMLATIREDKTEVQTNKQKGKDELYDRMYKVFSEYIKGENLLHFFYDDMDGDGAYEAFGITGDDKTDPLTIMNVRLYYISADCEVKPVNTDEPFMGYLPEYEKEGHLLDTGRDKLLVWEYSAGGSVSNSYVFGVKEGKVHELKESRNWSGLYKRREEYAACDISYESGYREETPAFFIYDDMDHEFVRIGENDFTLQGNSIFFGHYEQDGDFNNGAEPIEWRVLDVDGGWALLMSEYLLDVLPYTDDPDHYDYESGWESNYIREWLNSDFFPSAFDELERGRIRSTVPDEKDYLTSFLDLEGKTVSTLDKIFLLSINDIQGRYFPDLSPRYYGPGQPITEDLQARYTTYASMKVPHYDGGNGEWWLRDDMWIIFGQIGPMENVTANLGIRPALWMYIGESAEEIRLPQKEDYDWRASYRDYIESEKEWYMSEKTEYYQDIWATGFELAYVDDDDIPELFVRYEDDYSSWVGMCKIMRDGRVSYVYICYEAIGYNEREGTVITCDDMLDESAVISFEEGETRYILAKYDDQYYVNGAFKKGAKDEYDKEYDSYKRRMKTFQMKSYDDILLELSR